MQNCRNFIGINQNSALESTFAKNQRTHFRNLRARVRYRKKLETLNHNCRIDPTSRHFPPPIHRNFLGAPFITHRRRFILPDFRARSSLNARFRLFQHFLFRAYRNLFSPALPFLREWISGRAALSCPSPKDSGNPLRGHARRDPFEFRKSRCPLFPVPDLRRRVITRKTRVKCTEKEGAFRM